MIGCAQSLDTYCSGTYSGCVRDYPANVCVDGRTSFYRCGAFKVIHHMEVDTGSNAFYDALTGKLVALVDYSANTSSESCVAGPSDFAIPAANECTAPEACGWPDGGPDAQGDGG